MTGPGPRSREPTLSRRAACRRPPSPRARGATVHRRGRGTFPDQLAPGRRCPDRAETSEKPTGQRRGLSSAPGTRPLDDGESQKFAMSCRLRRDQTVQESMLPATFLSRCPSRARHFGPPGAHSSRRAGGSTGVTPRASATRLRLRATPSAASPRAVARAPAGSHGRGGGHHPNSGDPAGQEGQPETE